MPLITVLSYLPSVEWFTALTAHDEILFDHEMHYERWMGLNQTTLLTANGKLKLSVPLEKQPNHTRIKDIRISNQNNWKKKHWQSILSSYGRSAYFLYYADKFEMIYRKKFMFLKDLNETLFELCLELLKLQISFSVTGVFQKQYAEKYIDKRWIRKNETPPVQSAEYRQVFGDKEFIPGISIIDLLFNEGPDSGKHLSLK